MIFRRRYLGNFKEESETRNMSLGGPQKLADNFWVANKDVLVAAMNSDNSNSSTISPSQWMNTLASDAVFAQNLSDEPFKVFYNTHIKSLLQSECDRFNTTAQTCPDGVPLVELFIESWNVYYRKAATLSHLLAKCDGRLAGIRANFSHDYMTIQPTARCMWSTSAEKSGVSLRVSQALCTMIKNEREGTVTPNASHNDLIKRCLDAFVEIGVDEADPIHTVSKNIYVSWFEKMFLEETSKFLSNEILTYLPKGLKCMTELIYSRVTSEEVRLGLYLQRDPTEKRLYNVLNTVFVMEYKDYLTKYFEEVLKVSDEEAMGQAYSLLDRVHGYVEPLYPMIQAQIEHDGLAATDVSASKSVDVSSPEFYVRAVVGVYDKYEGIIERRLKKNKNIHAVLSIACTKFANDNAFLRSLTTSSSSSGNSPKMVAAQCVVAFADNVLKKGNPQSAVEGDRDAAIKAFGFLEDKDYFMFFHSRKLANRLLNGLSTSIDDEKAFIARIKDNSNFNDTSIKKMEDMIHDIEQSSDLQPLFAKFCEGSNSSGALLPTGSLLMRVLNKVNWSIAVQPMDQNIYIPCESLRNTLAEYEKFYLSRNKNTRFVHVHSQSRAEIEFKNGSHHYRMMASAYQTAILLLFSSSSAGELTLGEIASKLHVGDASELLLSILGITKTKILLPSVAVPASWDANTVFKFNVKFMSKKPKFTLPQEKSLSILKTSVSPATPTSPSRSSSSLSNSSKCKSGSDEDGNGKMVVEDVGTPAVGMEEIENGRILCIKAAVVRVMKGRKVLSFNGLHDEVAAQLKSWFVMPTKLFKKAVESLVDEEYLNRSTEFGNVKFEYIS